MRRIAPSAAWLALVAFLVLLLAAGAWVVQRQGQQDLAGARAAAQLEADLVASLVQNELRRGSYQRAEELLLEWGRATPDAAALRLTAGNGFLLGEYRRPAGTDHALTVERRIAYGYRDEATLTLVKDLAAVAERRDLLRAQAVAGFLLTAGLLVALALALSSQRREAAALRQRTLDLDAANAGLAEEMARREEVEQERSRLIAIIEATTDLVSMADTQGNVLYLNRAGRAMTGIGDASLAGMRISHLHPAWAAELIVGQGIPAALRDGAWSGETALLGPDGREIPVSQLILSHRDAHGEVSFLSTVMRDISERKRAHEALLQSEERLQQAVRVSQIGIFDHDHRTDTIYWSPEQRRIHGWGPDEPVSLRAFVDSVHPDDRKMIAQAVRRAHDPAGDGRYDVQHRIIRRDGELRWVLTRSQTYFEDDGNGRRPVRTVGADLDLTERKRAEAELRRAQFLVENAVQEIWLASPDGRLLYANRAAAASLGYTQQELAAMTVADVDPVNGPRFVEHAQALKQGGAAPVLETEHLARDGRRIPKEVRASHLRLGDEEYICGFVTDISERRRAEQALDRFKSTLDQTLDSVFMFEPDTLRFFYVNQGATQQVGYSEEELLRMTPVDIKPEFDEARFRELVAPLVSGSRSSLTFETVHRRKDGTLVPVEIFLQYIATDAAPRFVAIVRDVTERRQAAEAIRRLNADLEQRVHERTHELAESNAQLRETLASLERARDELVRSEKLASLGALVAGVAHELSTPLGNGLTVASTLAEQTKAYAAEVASGTLRRSSLDGFIESAGQAATLLTRSLHAASELIGHFKQVAVDQTSAQRRAFDLGEVVSEVAETLQLQFKRTPHRMDLAIPAGLAMDSYPGPLGQVVTNLVMNALIHAFDASRPGTVRLAAEPVGDDRVRLIVADDGRGIAPEHLPRIFDPFFTTRLGQGGSGLGLHIVYSLATRVLGGRIDARNKPEGGAAFTLELPLSAPVQDNRQQEGRPRALQQDGRGR